MVYASRGILRILLALLLFSFDASAESIILSTNAAEQYLHCIFDGGHNCDLYLANLNFVHHNPSVPVGGIIELPGRTLPFLQEAVHNKETAGNVLTASFFIEAHCPDTTRFVHSQLWHAWQRLFATNRIVWTVVPFGKARCLPRGNSDFSCQCQHGPNECELNQLMNCVIDQLRYPSDYMPFINCIQGKTDLLDARRQCLDGQQLVSVSRLLDCASGIEGRRLLARAGQATMQLQPPLTFVPWITLDGVRSVDAMYDLRENLCNRLIPPPPQCL